MKRFIIAVVTWFLCICLRSSKLIRWKSLLQVKTSKLLWLNLVRKLSFVFLVVIVNMIHNTHNHVEHDIVTRGHPWPLRGSTPLQPSAYQKKIYNLMCNPAVPFLSRALRFHPLRFDCH